MRHLLVLWFLFAAVPAFAYLDPATGSLLLYALVGIATTAAVALRNLWYALRGRRLSLGPAVRGPLLPDVVFHSEGGRYWPVFQPVIEALGRRGVRCAYVSPDPGDPGLRQPGGTVEPIRPGSELATIAWMNSLQAPLVVSTTPHLDVYMLKRSRRVRHYTHLFHAPTDVAFYEKFAFDWYDSLLTVGRFQERSVRTLEARRGLAAKALYPTGCTYYDTMLAEVGSLPPRQDEQLTVLYAPAWGVRSSLGRYGVAILETLARSGIRTIFRPHPQSYVSDRDLVRGIEGKAAGWGTVTIDRARTGTASMHRADLMITDLSGVLFDYAFLFERPILLACSDVDLGGQEAEDLDGEIWDIAAARRLARVLEEAELGWLPDVVREMHARPQDYRERARAIREDELFNFGKAGEAAARNILSLLEAVS